MAAERDSVPVTELGEDAAAIVRRIRESQRPVVITEGGRAAAVVLSVETFERDERERELLRLLLRGEQEIDAGTGYDLEQVLEEADRLLAADGP